LNSAIHFANTTRNPLNAPASFIASKAKLGHAALAKELQLGTGSCSTATVSTPFGIQQLQDASDSRSEVT